MGFNSGFKGLISCRGFRHVWICLAMHSMLIIVSFNHHSVLLLLLSALQPWVSLGLLNNQSPLLSVFHLLYPLLYLHYFQVCYNVIHPSQTRSSSPSSYKQSSFHHLPWHHWSSFNSYINNYYDFHKTLNCLSFIWNLKF